MVPVPSYQALPTFGGGATLVQPIAGTYNGGFLPGQLFPAEYENWLMNFITANSNTSETSVLSMSAELVNILTAASITPIPATNTQVKQALDALYLSLTGGTLTGALKLGGALNMSTFKINNVVDPTSAQDAATKNYVDSSTLLSTEKYTSTFTSGSFQDQIASMAVGETRMVTADRLNNSGAANGYGLQAPAIGTFTFAVIGVGSSNINTMVSNSGIAAAGALLTTPSVDNGARAVVFATIKRTA